MSVRVRGIWGLDCLTASPILAQNVTDRRHKNGWSLVAGRLKRGERARSHANTAAAPRRRRDDRSLRVNNRVSGGPNDDTNL